MLHKCFGLRGPLQETDNGVCFDCGVILFNSNLSFIYPFIYLKKNFYVRINEYLLCVFVCVNTK